MCKIVVIALFPSGSSVFFDIFFSTWPRVQLFLLLGPLYGELLLLSSPLEAHLQELCLDELHWIKLRGSRSFIGDKANLTRNDERVVAVEPVDVLRHLDCHLAQFVKTRSSSACHVGPLALERLIIFNNFELIWHIWTSLEPIWTHLNSFEQVLNKFEPTRS